MILLWFFLLSFSIWEGTSLSLSLREILRVYSGLPSTQNSFQVFARWFFHGFCCVSFLKYDVLSMWHPWASSALKLKGSSIHDHELFVSSFAMMAVLGWEGFWFRVVQIRTFLLNWLQRQTFSPTLVPQRGAGSQLLHWKHSKVLLWTLRASFA